MVISNERCSGVCDCRMTNVGRFVQLINYPNLSGMKPKYQSLLSIREIETLDLNGNRIEKQVFNSTSIQPVFGNRDWWSIVSFSNSMFNCLNRCFKRKNWTPAEDSECGRTAWSVCFIPVSIKFTVFDFTFDTS